MKFSIDTVELTIALKQVAGGVDKDASNVYDKCLLNLKRGTGQFSTVSHVITATSQEINADYSGEPTAMLLDYGMLTQIVSSFGRRSIEVITFTEDDGKLVINGGATKYEMPTYNINDFPAEFEINMNTTASVDSDLFSQLLNVVKHASAVRDVRYFLNGVFFEVNADVNELRLVGTDGHRMNIGRMPFNSLSTTLQTNKIGYIIPPKMVDEIVSVIKSVNTKELTLCFDAAHIHLECGYGRKITGRLVDGRYPDYRRVIPEDTTQTLEVDRNELKLFLSSTFPLNETGFPVGKFTISSKGMNVLIDGGTVKAEASFQVDGFQGDETIELAYNTKYISDVLNAHSSEKITFLLSDRAIKICNEYNPNLLSLVVPVRL